MPSGHPRPWHRHSTFSEGPRHPLDRERRAVWRARVEIHRRAGQITADGCYVAEALAKRLGQDGRCDPSHQTLADDSGESVSTVKRALKALHACGLVMWVRRLIRNGRRVAQGSNGYLLTLGNPPQIPPVRASRSDVQSDRESLKEVISTLPTRPEDVAAAQRALANRRRVIEEKLLTKTTI